MKKNYSLIDPKMAVARRVEAVKSEIRKYIKRERKKSLPEGVDFCDFACKFGADAESAADVHVSQFNALLDAAEKDQLESVYVEIIAVAGYRTSKEKPAAEENPAAEEADKTAEGEA
ncbi:DUF6172 family protein [Persicirhabdus sediminis]|uniref:Uncharacterized protein n=1 Tax=Persicirhabdus sediminis TaxID=454144 RepID=A0A8J7SLL5_9BACT|nr:DUF6172 family protein [Persicirhabdus sediminis]MBK1791455.1 hypothetical protein [Persicirhabdus sediminis]